MKMLMIFIHLWKSFFVLFCFIFFFKNDNVEEGTVFFTVISLIIFYLFHLPLPSWYFSRTLPSNCQQLTQKDTLHSCTVCAVCFVETKCKYFQSDQRLLIFISILFRCSHQILTRVFTVQLAQVLGRKSKTSFCAIMCYKTENGTAMIGRRIRGKPPFLFLLRQDLATLSLSQNLLFFFYGVSVARQIVRIQRYKRNM